MSEIIDFGNFQMPREELMGILGGLAPREQKTICLRYGILDGTQRTLEQIAQEFNEPIEQVRELKASAVRKILCAQLKKNKPK